MYHRSSVNVKVGSLETITCTSQLPVPRLSNLPEMRRKWKKHNTLGRDAKHRGAFQYLWDMIIQRRNLVIEDGKKCWIVLNRLGKRFRQSNAPLTADGWETKFKRIQIVWKSSFPTTARPRAVAKRKTTVRTGYNTLQLLVDEWVAVSEPWTSRKAQEMTA